MTTITDELRQAVERAGAEPVLLEDPETRRTYILISEEEYRRLRDRPVDDGTPSIAEQRAMLARLGTAVGWDGPAMDVYDRR